MTSSKLSPHPISRFAGKILAFLVFCLSAKHFIAMMLKFGIAYGLVTVTPDGSYGKVGPISLDSFHPLVNGALSLLFIGIWSYLTLWSEHPNEKLVCPDCKQYGNKKGYCPGCNRPLATTGSGDAI